LALLGVAVVAAAMQPARRLSDRMRLAVQERRARMIADDPGMFTARISQVGPKEIAATIAARLPAVRKRSQRLELTSSLMMLSERAGGDTEARAAGVAYLLTGDFAEAATAFSSIPADRRDAHAWNDIAAAEWAAADMAGDAQRLLTALAAADRAITLDPAMREAHFNRALIVRSMGFLPIARRLWTDSPDASSEWKRAAQQHIASIPQTHADGWRLATENNAADYSTLTLAFPLEARGYGEGPFLALWAEESRRGNVVAARQHLERARAIALVLHRDHGESLLLDSISAIDTSAAPAHLIAGYLAYREGRKAYGNFQLAAAEPLLEAAERSFRSAHSPMAGLARFYRGSIMFDQHRTAEALDILTPLLETERSQGRHRALIARTLHEIALCEAIRGHWSASLAVATESMTIFRSLGETGNAAAAEAILIENYNFLARPDLAWKHGIAAVRGSCLAGDVGRARVALAALCRTELRGRRWENAAAVVRLEKDAISLRADPLLDTDLFLREGAAAAHLGDSITADRAFRRARTTASKLSDDATRTRLIMDIEGVEGSIVRLRHPRQGIALLTSAIEFQREAIRPIVLPELHLERGRAFLALGQLDKAKHDFDEGILELERERREVGEAELRSGIFDDAAALFDEVVALAIREQDPAAALAYIERGRARTMLEQIDAGPLRVPTLHEVQQQLRPDAAIIEYVPLPDRLALFVITRDQLAVRVVLVSREQLSRIARDLIDALTTGTADAWRAPATRLYDLLIAPVNDPLKNVSALTVIADDILQRVPFPALFDRSGGAFLIEQFAISTAPSAGVVWAVAERLRNRDRSPRDSVLIFANPTPPPTFASLPPLDSAEREAVFVARAHQSARIATRDTATADRFFRDAPAFRFVHFAGHAVMQNAEPGNSALICASPANGGGAVTSRQIARMRFTSTDVVILAACSTMTGRNAAVEGVSSIARAFLVAGVPSVVGTLWDIEDRDAAPLMRALHENLARNASAVTALRAAQLAAIHTGDAELRHPRSWAAFAVTGVSTLSETPGHFADPSARKTPPLRTAR
jgi:CHAT domain-containing protein